MLESLIVIFPGIIAALAYCVCNYGVGFKINWRRLAALILFYIISINLCILGGLYMIGMRSFNLFEMGLSFKLKWLMLELALGVVITLVYWNISMFCRQKLSLITHIKKLIPAVVFLNVIYAVFTPSSLFLGNIDEFAISYIKMLPVIIGGTVLLTVVVYIAALLFTNEKTAVYSMAVIFAAALGAYVQGNFLNPVFPTLDGTEIKWAEYASESRISMIFWSLCILIILLLSFLWKEKMEKVIKYASYFFSAIQLVSLIVLIFTNRLDASVDHGFSKEGEFSLGSEQNIVIFVVDTLQASSMAEYISSDAYAEGRLDDFTFFEDTVSGAAPTQVAMPLLLTGVEYDPAQPIEEYLHEAWEETRLYDDLRQNGYDVRFYSNLNYISGFGDEIVENYGVTGTHWIGDYPEFGKQLYKLVNFYLLPQPIKKYFWLSTDALTDIIEVEKNSYRINDVEFYKDLHTAASLDVDYAKAFRLYHLNGVHSPRKMNENAEHVPNLKVGLPEQQTLQGIMKIIYEYMDDMKAAGVYEESTIIIAGDHGKHAKGNPETNPAVLIKEPHKSHPLEYNSAPIHFRNIVALMAESFMDDYSAYGPSVYDIDEYSDVERLHTIDWSVRGRIDIAGPVDMSLDYTRLIISGKSDEYQYRLWNIQDINRIEYKLGGDIIDFKSDNDYAKALDYRLYKEDNQAIASNELSICFELDNYSKKDMEFHFVCSDVYNDSQTIRFYANGKKLENVTCTKEDIGTEKTLQISPKNIQDGKLALRMVFPGAVTPNQLDRSNSDTRVLSVAFDSMWLTQ